MGDYQDKPAVSYACLYGFNLEGFEPVEGVYDFAGFEEAQQMARWRQDGQRVVFRFVSDKPGDEAHMDIPDWLFEKMNGDGEFYDNQYGKGFSLPTISSL